MSEELEEQTSLQIYDAAELATLEDQEDLVVKLKLPNYADVTDATVIKGIREVYSGFTFNASEDFSKIFTDPDKLADYIKDTISDISEKQKNGQVVVRTSNAASMARFWAMGYAIDKAISGSSYGNGACKVIAERINRSVPYIYQLRSVGTRLTLQDCFLLGMREGCNTTTLRKLAQIRDQDLCRQLITTFIESTRDTSDVIAIERATHAFKQAIRDALKPDNVLEEATTNPTESSENLEDIAGTAYVAGLSAVKKIIKETKFFSNEENVCSVCDAMADFAIVESVPDAEQLLSDFKVEVEEAINQSKKMMEYLDDMLVELNSLMSVEVLGEGSKRKRSK
jgi:hypothetical protein